MKLELYAVWFTWVEQSLCHPGPYWAKVSCGRPHSFRLYLCSFLKILYTYTSLLTSCLQWFPRFWSRCGVCQNVVLYGIGRFLIELHICPPYFHFCLLLSLNTSSFRGSFFSTVSFMFSVELPIAFVVIFKLFRVSSFTAKVSVGIIQVLKILLISWLARGPLKKGQNFAQVFVILLFFLFHSILETVLFVLGTLRS